MSKRFWIVCTCALAVGFLAAGYLNYLQYQRASDNNRLLNGTITDLQYQLKQDQKSASPTPSPTSSPSPSSTSPSPSPTPTISSPTPVVTTPLPSAPAAATATTNQLAKLHVSPSTNSATKVTLPAQTSVTLTGPVTNKYQPVSINGQTGYVYVPYLKY